MGRRKQARLQSVPRVRYQSNPGKAGGQAVLLLAINIFLIVLLLDVSAHYHVVTPLAKVGLALSCLGTFLAVVDYLQRNHVQPIQPKTLDDLLTLTPHEFETAIASLHPRA